MSPAYETFAHKYFARKYLSDKRMSGLGCSKSMRQVFWVGHITRSGIEAVDKPFHSHSRFSNLGLDDVKPVLLPHLAWPCPIQAR